MSVLVAAPPVPPQRFNLLDTIETKPLPQYGGVEGIQYTPYYCGVTEAVYGVTNLFCSPTAKTFTDGIPTASGSPVLIYKGVQCRLIGADNPEEFASKSLDLGASHSLEQAVGSLLADASTSITPATVPGVVLGIGLLENTMSSFYGGQVVLYMSRTIATIALSMNILIEVNGHLETKLGSLVIAGSGLGPFGPTPAAAGDEWILASGQINIWKGDTIVTPVTLDTPYDNQFSALAERLYVPAWECSVGAIEVKQEA